MHSLNISLLESAEEGHPLTSKTLVEAGASVNYNGTKGSTPLHLAAKQNHPKTLKMLLNLGADINRQDSLGRTSLMLSAWMGNIDATQLLLEEGADKNILDNQGYKAFYGIKADEEWVDLLERHWTKIPVKVDSCDLLVGDASIYKPQNSNTWITTVYNLYKNPR